MEIEKKIEEGKNLLRSKQFKYALYLFFEICKIDEPPVYAWYGLGIAALRTSKTTLAFRALRNALSLGAGYPDCLLAMKEILLTRKKIIAYAEISKRYDNWFPFLINKYNVKDSEKIPPTNAPVRFSKIYIGKPLDNLTIICHFFNEEYLLPWWLLHHTKIAKNGILINYSSNDRSVAICQQYAPHWRVVESKNSFFSAKDADFEVMEYERNISGWKLSLNITEFLHISNLHVDKIFQNNLPMSIALQGIVMVSDSNTDGIEGSYNKSILSQFRRGLKESKYSELKNLMTMRSRILHSYETGRYYLGRHFCEHATKYEIDGPFILWYGYSPWNQKTLNRKLQIKSRIPLSDLKNNWGSHHIIDEIKLIDEKKALDKHSDEIIDIENSINLEKIPTTLFYSVSKLNKVSKIFIPSNLSLSSNTF